MIHIWFYKFFQNSVSILKPMDMKFCIWHTTIFLKATGHSKILPKHHVMVAKVATFVPIWQFCSYVLVSFLCFITLYAHMSVL